MLDVARRDVGVGVDAECHDVTEEPFGARHHAPIVGIGDEHVVGTAAVEDLGLGVGNGISRFEEPEMGVTDVGPHADVGLRDANQRSDFSRMIHAQLDDCNLRPRPQLKK